MYLVITESHTTHINGKPFTLNTLEENFVGNWKHSAPQTYKPPAEFQSSMEKESTLMMNPTKKAISSFLHASTSDKAEEVSNKDCNDDTNIMEQVNLKLDTNSSDRIGWSGDLDCSFNEPFPHVKISADVETRSPQEDGTINAMKGTQKEAYYREADDTVQLLPVDQVLTKRSKYGPTNLSEQARSFPKESTHCPAQVDEAQAAKQALLATYPSPPHVNQKNKDSHTNSSTPISRNRKKEFPYSLVYKRIVGKASIFKCTNER
ncbi:hypothetical protein Ancab_034131 [Ancistrocladus abbreviatus]